MRQFITMNYTPLTIDDIWRITKGVTVSLEGWKFNPPADHGNPDSDRCEDCLDDSFWAGGNE